MLCSSELYQSSMGPQMMARISQAGTATERPQPRSEIAAYVVGRHSQLGLPTTAQLCADRSGPDPDSPFLRGNARRICRQMVADLSELHLLEHRHGLAVAGIPAPDDRPELSVDRVEPVRHTRITGSDDRAETPVGIDPGLGAIEARLPPDELQRVPDFVVELHVPVRPHGRQLGLEDQRLIGRDVEDRLPISLDLNPAEFAE